jgi:hypothetical protein
MSGVVKVLGCSFLHFTLLIFSSGFASIALFDFSVTIGMSDMVAAYCSLSSLCDPMHPQPSLLVISLSSSSHFSYLLSCFASFMRIYFFSKSYLRISFILSFLPLFLSHQPFHLIFSQVCQFIAANFIESRCRHDFGLPKYISIHSFNS